MKHETPRLDLIENPAQLRQLSVEELPKLCDELRQELIRVVSQTGGHLGAGLGVVELTVALHYVFDTPHDKLIWDVGHQAYPHKMLTGRRHAMGSIRQYGGISGFTKRSESEYDPFGAGHSSTSISAALGMATASQYRGEKRNVVAVIGDGALSAGLAYEAMNNAAALQNGLIVVLNDNEMSIAPAVGAMSGYLSRLFSGSAYSRLRRITKRILDKSSFSLAKWVQKTVEHFRGYWTGGTLFEELGFTHIGLIDGHDVRQLVTILANVRDYRSEKPVLVHVRTRKGHGYPPAEKSADKYHGVVKFDPDTGQQRKSGASIPSYTSVFANALIAEAKRDTAICAITAAMPEGTGITKFKQTFPGRAFDVGIAEQHAVTFAAGLAAEGMKPFVAIYSTFLQRAYDQIVHDVAVQALPVRFAIDRAGLVGADGATHVGAFDIAFLAALPGAVLMAASDEAELVRMVSTAADYNDGPSFFRYPRGSGVGVDLPAQREVLDIGRARMVHEGERVALLSYGARLSEIEAAITELKKDGIQPTVVDARFAKPLDIDMIRALCHDHSALLTLEEGSVGGFGTHVLSAIADGGWLHNCACRCMTLPDRWIHHGSMSEVYEEAGLNASHIAQRVRELLVRNH